MMKNIIQNDLTNEITRCLNCANPNCVKGCPLSNDIPNIIKNIKQGNLEEGYNILLNTSLIPQIPCMICPSYLYCEDKCVLKKKGNCIQIQNIERFLVQYGLENNFYKKYINKKIREIEKREIKIAIIGSGVSSLCCAKYLSLRGYIVDIFEKNNKAGGIVENYIPNYRINENIINNIVRELEKFGVNFIYNAELGKDFNIKDLVKKGYKAIYLGIGAQKPKKLNIEGKELKNIITWDEFLYKYKMNNDFKEILNKKLVILGGGSTALDCASVANRVGIKDITIVYRRTNEEMKVSKDELKEIENINIKFEYLSLPIKYIGKYKLEKIECIKMRLGEKDEQGRKIPIPIENSNYEIDADFVILALGNEIEYSIIKNQGIQADNLIDINENGQTNIEYIFAGGDVSTNDRNVTKASCLGFQAGKGIEKYIKYI